MTYPILYLKKNEDARLRRGHLWIFSNQIDTPRSPLTAFTPGDLAQATDRAHRIGQKASVTAWYPVAENTIEEKIVELLQSKSQVIGQTIDGNAQAMNINILGELVSQLHKLSN